MIIWCRLGSRASEETSDDDESIESVERETEKIFLFKFNCYPTFEMSALK